ncbi:ASCH domain-containing protein [Salinibacterium sp.]|uniref:ASCH domain-containing protein n=1 Tax=Salinibacterium sp. TaxID=1915057 RepID=UPI00286B1976|nr:ASCH domain-containing protein [Salinibacterium sp.]
MSAILAGAKTSTTSTVVEYRIYDEPFPQVGAQQAVVDSASAVVAVIETTQVDHVPSRAH